MNSVNYTSINIKDEQYFVFFGRNVPSPFSMEKMALKVKDTAHWLQIIRQP
ncbi:MAG: hypothetical protein ACTSWN_08975 [Promethearchaeota archaeon]